MSRTTVLYIIIVFMQLIALVHHTVLDEDWGGIAMWLSTLAFVGATIVFSTSRGKKPADMEGK